MFVPKGTKVYSRGGDEYGLTTGSERRCTMSCCNGVRIYVKWTGDKITMPCSAGLKFLEDESLQII